MAGSIRYIKFSGEYDKFDDWKDKTKEIDRQMALKKTTKELEIPTEDEEDNDEDKMKIYEGNSKAWDFLIISLTDITFGLVSQCDENAHHARKDLIDKYEVSDEKKESLNEVKNIGTTAGIRKPSNIQIFGSTNYTNKTLSSRISNQGMKKTKTK